MGGKSHKAALPCNSPGAGRSLGSQHISLEQLTRHRNVLIESIDLRIYTLSEEAILPKWQVNSQWSSAKSIAMHYRWWNALIIFGMCVQRSQGELYCHLNLQKPVSLQELVIFNSSFIISAYFSLRHYHMCLLHFPCFMAGTVNGENAVNGLLCNKLPHMGYWFNHL